MVLQLFFNAFPRGVFVALTIQKNTGCFFELLIASNSYNYEILLLIAYTNYFYYEYYYPILLRNYTI